MHDNTMKRHNTNQVMGRRVAHNLRRCIQRSRLLLDELEDLEVQATLAAIEDEDECSRWDRADDMELLIEDRHGGDSLDGRHGLAFGRDLAMIETEDALAAQAQLHDAIDRLEAGV